MNRNFIKKIKELTTLCEDLGLEFRYWVPARSGYGDSGYCSLEEIKKIKDIHELHHATFDIMEKDSLFKCIPMIEIPMKDIVNLPVEKITEDILKNVF